jgi:hypothetical protein
MLPAASIDTVIGSHVEVASWSFRNILTAAKTTSSAGY